MIFPYTSISNRYSKTAIWSMELGLTYEVNGEKKTSQCYSVLLCIVIMYFWHCVMLKILFG